MDTHITVEHVEELLKHLQRDDLDAAGRFAMQHPLFAPSIEGRVPVRQPCTVGRWMRDLALQAVHAITPDAHADSKAARARKLLELFYFKRLSRRQVMDKLGYSLNGEGSYARLRQHAIACFAQSLETVCLSLARMPEVPANWSRTPEVVTGRHVPRRTFNALVGRASELKQLEQWAHSPDQPNAMCIHGIGGVGKTALVTELAHRLLSQSPPNAFDDVLWVSAKRQLVWGNRTHAREIQPGSFQPHSPEAIVEALLRQVGVTHLLGSAEAEKRAALREEMSRRRYLIVLDNADELDAEAAIVAGLAPLLGPSKLLVTTRNPLGSPAGAMAQLGLRGLTFDDSAAYLRSEAEAKRITQLEGVGVTVLRDIYAVSHGVPLALKVLLGQFRHDTLSGVMQGRQAEAASANHKDFLRFLFEQSWRQLSEQERVLWMWLGRTTVAPVTRDQLIAIPQIVNGLDEALASLASRGVVEVTDRSDGGQAHFGLHPLAQTFVADLPRIVYVSESLRLFHQHKALALAAQGWLTYVDLAQVERAIQIDDARANMIGVAKGCLAAGLHGEVISLWDRLSEALFSHGYWRDYIELDYCCLAAARAHKQTDVEITVLCELGWALCDISDYAQARDCLTRALRLASEKRDLTAIVRIERYLATIDLRQKNYVAARIGFERLLDKIPRLLASVDEQTRTQLMRHKSTLHDSLASALMELGDLAGAEKQLAIRRQMPYAINSTTGARSLLNLARLRIKQAQLDEAEHHLMTCLDVCRRINARDAFADALTALAWVAVQRNDMQRAVGLAEEALQLFGAIGALKREQDTQRFLTSVHDGGTVSDPLSD